MSARAKHYRLGRIRIGNAAKVGGTLGCVVGFLGGLVHLVYFLSMGVPDGCVLVQKQATPSALRQVFRMVSQSAIRASQGLVQPGANAGFFVP